MAYDNLKLEKGLYTTGKSFTQALEQIDPSENYAGTPLEGLDAYQRQLKRFDIKVSGIGSDTVSKFFQTSDSAALFPEYVSRAVRQGMEQADVLQKIVATTTVIDGMDYRAIESVENGERLTAAEVAEGASLPTTTVQVKDTLTEMHKRGRMLVASYEAVKFQKLDLFTVTLRQIGNCIAEGQLLDAYAALIGVHDSGITLEGGLTYAGLVDLWNAFEGFNMTTPAGKCPGYRLHFENDRNAGCHRRQRLPRHRSSGDSAGRGADQAQDVPRQYHFGAGSYLRTGKGAGR